MRDFRTPHTPTADQIISRIREGNVVKPVRPVVVNCTCGCQQPIPSQRKRSLFLQGHDAKLKSLLIRVLDGLESSERIPSEAVERREFIMFLKSRSDLRDILNRLAH